MKVDKSKDDKMTLEKAYASQELMIGTNMRDYNAFYSRSGVSVWNPLTESEVTVAASGDFKYTDAPWTSDLVGSSESKFVVDGEF